MKIVICDDSREDLKKVENLFRTHGITGTIMHLLEFL